MPETGVAHTIRDKTKLLGRIRRIIGQTQAVERAMEGEQECAEILRLIAASRGAMNALMAEVLAEHIREHGLSTKGPNPDSNEVAEIVRAYLK
jgi:FrmR/RcnR family transcriptional regulator, repressor of frmRAB operon